MSSLITQFPTLTGVLQHAHAALYQGGPSFISDVYPDRLFSSARLVIDGKTVFFELKTSGDFIYKLRPGHKTDATSKALQAVRTAFLAEISQNDTLATVFLAPYGASVQSFQKGQMWSWAPKPVRYAVKNLKGHYTDKAALFLNTLPSMTNQDGLWPLRLDQSSHERLNLAQILGDLAPLEELLSQTRLLPDTFWLVAKDGLLYIQRGHLEGPEQSPLAIITQERA